MVRLAATVPICAWIVASVPIAPSSAKIVASIAPSAAFCVKIVVSANIAQPSAVVVNLIVLTV